LAFRGGGWGRAGAQDAGAAERANAALAGMSIRDKVARMFTVPILGVSLSAEEEAFLADYRPGGVLLVQNNIGTDEEVRALNAAIAATNPALPPFRTVDQEGGIVSRLAGDPAPDAPTLGQLPPAEIAALARARGEFLAGFGFDINFAPVADVAWTPGSFMTGRAFGGDPALVAEAVAAYVDGAGESPVLHCAKHFPGHGRPSTDSHEALPTVDVAMEEWLATDALPFIAAIGAGAPMVMLGHLAYPQWDALPASISPEAVRVLREDLGFSGVVVSDDLGMGALAAWSGTEAADLAVAAGLDMLLYAIPPQPMSELIDHLAGRVEAGDLPEARIEESVRRLLAMTPGSAPGAAPGEVTGGA
ncbi:MAG: glycoside hydrolase family 3 N-terminal domain-containing protein, partial [Chloroflexota bacterium]